MSFKEKLETFKTFLQQFADMPAAADTSAADALKDYATDSGAKLMIDKLEAGGKVYAEDGVTPYTLGFTLADGTIVAVDETGTITAVTAPVAAAADPLPAPAPVLPAGFMERFAEMEQELKDLKAAKAQQFSDHQTAAAAQVQKFTEALTQVHDLLASFAAQPGDDPAQAPGGAASKPTKEERAKQFLANVKAAKALKA